MLNYLFSDYDAIERPVENDSESLEVEVGLAVQQIIDIVDNTYKSKNIFLLNVRLFCIYIKLIMLLKLFNFDHKDEKQQTIIFSGWLDIVKIRDCICCDNNYYYIHSKTNSSFVFL